MKKNLPSEESVRNFVWKCFHNGRRTTLKEIAERYFITVSEAYEVVSRTERVEVYEDGEVNVSIR